MSGGTPADRYAAAKIHINLLNSHARTAAYQEVLAKHAGGKVVVEIGCGSGVLACFAAKTGAARVYAIEESGIIHIARRIARLNGLGHRIVFVPGNSLRVELPERADLVYSELLGSDTLSQDVLRCHRDALQRFLAPAGQMIPRWLALNGVYVESGALLAHHRRVQRSIRQARSLGGRYGLDLSPLVEAYERETRNACRSYASLERIEESARGDQRHQRAKILTGEIEIVRFDLAVVGDARPVRIPLRFQAVASGTHNAVTLSFTAQLDEEIRLSTSPFSAQPLANWSQVIRPVAAAQVRAGEVIQLEALVDPARRPSVSLRRAGCR
jgi:hypothetical protein